MNSRKIVSIFLLMTFLTTSISPAFASKEEEKIKAEVGNKIMSAEYPDSNNVVPDVKDGQAKVADFVIEGSVEKNIDITLSECIRFALGNNPRIRSAINDILAADTRVKQVWANYFPTISWSTSASKIRQLQLSDVLGESLVFNYFILGEVSLSEMLYDFGVTQNQATIKKLDYEGYKTTLTSVVNDVIYQTKDAYFNLLYAYDRVNVAEDTVSKFEAFYNQAKAFYEIGMNPKVDVTIAETNLSNAKLELIQAENSINLAIAKLNNVMGLPYITRYNVKERLQYTPVNMTLPEVMDIAQASRPELKLANIRVEAANQNIKLQKKAYFPKISVQGAYSVGGAHFTGNHGYNFGAYLDFPVVNGMKIYNQVKEARYSYDKQLAEAQVTKDTVDLEIQQAYLTLLEKKSQMPVAFLGVKQAKESYEQSYGRYREGEATPTELKDSQVSYKNAQLNYYSALYQYNSSKAALEKSIGKNLKGSGDEIIDFEP